MQSYLESYRLSPKQEEFYKTFDFIGSHDKKNLNEVNRSKDLVSSYANEWFEKIKKEPNYLRNDNGSVKIDEEIQKLHRRIQEAMQENPEGPWDVSIDQPGLSFHLFHIINNQLGRLGIEVVKIKTKEKNEKEDFLVMRVENPINYVLTDENRDFYANFEEKVLMLNQPENIKLKEEALKNLQIDYFDRMERDTTKQMLELHKEIQSEMIKNPKGPWIIGALYAFNTLPVKIVS